MEKIDKMMGMRAGWGVVTCRDEGGGGTRVKLEGKWKIASKGSDWMWLMVSNLGLVKKGFATITVKFRGSRDMRSGQKETVARKAREENRLEIIG